jgi:hypothetical protein
MLKEYCGTKEGYVPNVKELKDKILHEAHESTYSIHLGGNKMYHDLNATYWWYGMKRVLAEYVALCNTCQQLKAEHQRPAGFAATIASVWVEVGRDCHGFYHCFAKNSVWLWFYLGDCGSTDQGSSLYTCQDHLPCTATSRAVYVEDSLPAWSVKEDCVR